MFLSVLPELNAVDNVLPKHITACTNGGYGIKIGVGHPDGESRILLE
jgi:hypothetical protein